MLLNGMQRYILLPLLRNLEDEGVLSARNVDLWRAGGWENAVVNEANERT
jgi:hypothetical protein